MKRAIASLSGLLLCVGTLHADIFNFGLNSDNDTGGFLSGMFENPPNSSTATGGEVGVGISYDTATQIMDFHLAYGLFGFEPLTADYLASHIHQGPPGTNGPVLINLAPLHTPAGTRAGFYSGTLALTAEQQTALLNSELYVNIHSVEFQDGEIRAQLVPTAVPEPSLWALAGLGFAALLVMRRR